VLLNAELARREAARRNYLEFVKLMFETLAGKPMVVTPFQEHLATVCEYAIREMLAGREPRIIVEAPPRHGKSLFVSNFLIPWLFIQDPSLFAIHATYNQSYANDLGKLVREVMTHPLYQDLCPDAQPDPNVLSVNRIDTLGRGQYHASGVDGKLTGVGGHLLVLDDPIKNATDADNPNEMARQWEWYTRVFRQRAMPRCGVFIVLTRWGTNDVAGQVLEVARTQPDADQWMVFKYEAVCTDPALDPLRRPIDAPLDPIRYPSTALKRLKASISPRAWSAQFQQNPVPDSGGFFDMKELDEAIVPASVCPKISDLAVYIAVDFAIGEKEHNDYTVIWPFGVDHNDNVWFLPEAVRFKGNGGKIIDTLLDMADRLKARELILEDGHIYRALHSTIEATMRDRKQYFHITSPYPTKDKKARAEPLRARMQQKKLRFVDCPFVRDVLVHEAAAFGSDRGGTHDDSCDAAALGVGHLTRLMSGAKPAKPSEPEVVIDLSKGLTYDELMARAHPRAANRKHTVEQRGLVKVPSRLNGGRR
jgi:hypothetical protein